MSSQKWRTFAAKGANSHELNRISIATPVYHINVIHIVMQEIDKENFNFSTKMIWP